MCGVVWCGVVWCGVVCGVGGVVEGIPAEVLDKAIELVPPARGLVESHKLLQKCHICKVLSGTGDGSDIVSSTLHSRDNDGGFRQPVQAAVVVAATAAGSGGHGDSTAPLWIWMEWAQTAGEGEGGEVASIR